MQECGSRRVEDIGSRNKSGMTLAEGRVRGSVTAVCIDNLITVFFIIRDQYK